MTYVSAVVEGQIDEAVIERLISDAGAQTARVYVKGGRGPLLAQMQGYRNAARLGPWVVLCDLDQDQCAPQFVAAHLPVPDDLELRVAVRAIEAWLLADPGLARVLGIQQAQLPRHPELELRPKQTLINLARNSPRRRVRQDIGGRPGQPDPGPMYNETLIDFVNAAWNPLRAAERSPSLRRAMEAVARVAGG